MRGLLFEGLDVSKQRGKRRPWVAAASFGLHAAAGAALVLVQLLSTDTPPVIANTIPMCKWPEAPVVTLPPKPPETRAMPPARTQRTTRATQPAQSIAVPLDIPDHIPTGDPPPVDPGATLVIGDACPGCDPAPPGTPVGGGDPEPGPGVGGRPVPVGGDIRPPRKLKHVAPVYPATALAARMNATVILDCIIDADGRVTSARVVSGHPLFNEASVETVQQWVYQPTLLNGVPVAVQMTVTLRYSQTR